jgi:DNA polymerase Ligase (LigD)
MPRFVVLTHDHPLLHWDLMLEQGDCLRTWRLAQPPDAAGSIVAEALPDHRLAYLDYEGPVSGDRGTVQRWDAGAYEILESSSNRLLVRFAGERLIGVAPLRRRTAEGAISNLPAQTLRKLGSRWTFWKLPLEGPIRVVKIPQLLAELIAKSRWPASGKEAWKQRCAREPQVSKDRVKLLAPDEERIDLDAPIRRSCWTIVKTTQTRM